MPMRKTLLAMPVPSCHASTIAFVGDDVLLCCFAGTAEGADDVGIYGLRKIGESWSEPTLLAKEYPLPHWNPVLHAEGKRVTLYYKAGTPIPRWHTRYIVSEDGGCTFTAPAELVPGDIGGRGPVRNKLLCTDDGTFLAPASIETETRWDAFVDISRDGGKSFVQSEFVPLWRKGDEMPPYPVHEPFCVQGKGVIQPTLWQTADGEIHMLLRSSEGVILRSDSSDGGRSWCPAYSTGMPNNNSGIDIAQGADGALYLALNPVPANWGKRTPLCVWKSTDAGAHFAPFVTLETEDGEFSYPAIRVRGNTLHVSYTWNRQKIAYCEIDL